LADGRPDAGIEALKKAVTLGAGPAASLDLAKAFLSREMWAESIDHLETVLRSDPGDAEALRLLGAAYYQIKRFELAAKTYQKAHRIEPTPRTLISAVIALQGAGAWARALGIIDELLPQMPRLPEIGFHRATLLERLGRADEARQAYQAYLAVAVGHPDEGKRVAAARARLDAPTRPEAPPSLPPVLPPPVAPLGGSAAQGGARPVEGPGHDHPPGSVGPDHRHGVGGHVHE
jgi:tetratricopeptide (TPR) repeat protein